MPSCWSGVTGGLRSALSAFRRCSVPGDVHAFCFSHQLRCPLSPTQGLWFGYRTLRRGFPGGSNHKESACNAGDLGSIPELGRFPKGGHGASVQYSCLENSHGQRSLSGYSPQGRKELDMTEQLSPQHILFFKTKISTSKHLLQKVAQILLNPLCLQNNNKKICQIVQLQILEFRRERENSDEESDFIGMVVVWSGANHYFIGD